VRSLLASGIALLATLNGAWTLPAWADDCPIDTRRPITIPSHKTKQNPNDQSKHAYRLPDGSIVFLGSLTVDADGAPRAYGPNNSGLDDTVNAGSSRNWYGLATDAPRCKPSGTPLIQSASDPAPGFYVSTTTMTNPAIHDCRRPGNYVDASSIPYVALSPLVATVDIEHGGRLVAVSKVSGGTPQSAIHADQGPKYGIGEASIALVRRLGLDPDPRAGGSDVREFVYVVMTERSSFPSSAREIEDKVGTAFKRWGGTARLEACKQALLTAPQ
jgi:hypothetical protein